jgi:hypothetical protein
MTEERIQLKKMLEAEAPDVTLQAGDIQFVPLSGGRVLAGRTFAAAMSLATAVTIYTVHAKRHPESFWLELSPLIWLRRLAAVPAGFPESGSISPRSAGEKSAAGSVPFLLPQRGSVRGIRG